MLAKISPFTYSSSFTFLSGCPSAVTRTRRRSRNVAGSMNRSTSVPVALADQTLSIAREALALASVCLKVRFSLNVSRS